MAETAIKAVCIYIPKLCGARGWRRIAFSLIQSGLYDTCYPLLEHMKRIGPDKPPLSIYQPTNVHTQSPLRNYFKFEREGQKIIRHMALSTFVSKFMAGF